MGIGVAGGEGGIAAFLEDLVAVSHVLSATADTVDHARDEASFGRLQIGGCGGLDLGAHNAALDDILGGLSRPAAGAQHAAHDLRRVASVVRWAAESYDQADHGIWHQITSAVEGLPGAVLKGGARLVISRSPSEALQQVATADPELADLACAVVNVPRQAEKLAEGLEDGHAVVTDEHNDVSAAAVTAPRDYSDLVSGLSERNEGVGGEIGVSFAFGTGGVRHVIVTIPGTKSWSLGHTPDVTSMATNARAINGEPTTYERGVLEAMREAGVTAKDDVMLVGHSEGGMVAVAAARDAVKGGEFHVSHVVTAGSPIGKSVAELPRSVQVLALEDRGDQIPQLDGAHNPDLPNVTTVTGGPDHGTVKENHSLDESYLPLATSVDSSGNSSIKAFTDSAHGFFDQNLMTTEKFLITREY